MNYPALSIFLNFGIILTFAFLLLRYSNTKYIAFLVVSLGLAYYGFNERMNPELQQARGHASTYFYLPFLMLLYWQIFRALYKGFYRQEPTITWPGASTKSMDILNERKITYGDGFFTIGIFIAPFLTIILLS
ncbi:hypothetical protein QYS48_30165 [Marivirga arenosa]|uniref:Uncharacterized protein n=1 Tax=Marivirga arenosa TaxID=3059076 RepID=A0AA51N821_9BACT|nr:hypothetical protein [Marivirga sp. ABR2-2]WMN07869.1 hypothetical protein QYS48_30165 [Marivirga sp. ABR2-2]